MKRGYELFEPVFKGKLPDRVPISLNLLDQGAKEMNMDLSRYYSRGEYIAEGQIRLYEKYGGDLVWGFLYMGHMAEILGCRKIRFYKDGPPNVADMIIKDPSDIEKLRIPEDIYNEKSFSVWRTSLEILAREYQGKAPVFTSVVGSFTLPILLMGVEKWIQLLFTGDQKYVQMLLEKCHLFCVRLISALRKAGAQIIVYTNPFGTIEFISHDLFIKLGLPWAVKDFKEAGSSDLIYFCGGGRLEDQVADVQKACNAHSFYISPFDSIRAVKESTGHRAIVAGPLNDMLLLGDQDPGTIREAVRLKMEEGGPGGGYVFGTLVMPYLIPENNIKVMMEAAWEYGDYNYLNGLSL